MKPRAFRLAPILRLRERQLDAARGRLAAAVGERDAARAEQHRLLAVAEASGRELQARLVRGVAAGIVQSAGRSEEVQSAAAGAAAHRADALEEKVATARRALLEAKREVRGLEILEEKSRQRELAWRARRETRVLDELGARRRAERARTQEREA